MNKNIKIIAQGTAMVVFLIPVALCAAEIPSNLAPTCEGPDCGFNNLIEMVNKIISFLMYKIVVPLAALGFMFAGSKLIFSQNKESAWSEAKESFQNIVLGFIIMAGAFLVIKFLIYQFIDETQREFMDFLIG